MNSKEQKLLKKIVDENKLDELYKLIDEIPPPNEKQPDLKLWKFTRLYKIGKIPIVDFIFVYIGLYIINSLWFHVDHYLTLILTIPITLLLNIIFNKTIKITMTIFIIIIIFLVYAIFIVEKYSLKIDNINI